MVSHIDIAIVIAYMFACLVIGLLNYGKIKNIRDYTLGTKPFATTVLLATTLATAISALQIGHIGKIHKLGLIYIIPIFFKPISWLIFATLLIPNLHLFRKHKFISLSEIMEYWYGRTGRWVTNIISILLTVAITAVSIIAIGYLLHYFLNIPQNAGMIIGLAIVTTYSAFGGIASVAFTDVLQFLIFFIALPIACSIGLQHTGGIERIWAALPKTHTHIDNIPLFISFIFYALIPQCAIPYTQRALMAKDQKQFLLSFLGVAVLLIPIMVVISLIGLITYIHNANIDSSTVLYHFIDHYLPIGTKGFLIAGILAMIMSTQDSYLNTTSVLLSHDICKKIWPSLTDKQELLIARLSCIVVALTSISIIWVNKDIIGIIWLALNFFAPLISVPLLAGLLGTRINKDSLIFVVIASLITVTTTRFFTGAFDTKSATIGIITSAIVLYILHKKHKGRPIFSLPKVNMNLLFDNLNKRVLNNSYSISSLYTVGIALCINFLVGIFFANLDFFNPLNISLGAMVFSLLMLLLNELWHFHLKRYLIDIWRFCLIIGLLFIPSYIFSAHDFHILWLCNLILSVILFIVMSDIVIGIAFTLIAGFLGYLLSQIFYVEINVIEITFANISCPAMLIAILIQLYNRHTITKTTHKEITYELKKIMQEK
ncbi:MAG: sodium:solute symporter family protein, partial [Rickettsiales bacterium]|nr:sodium:solute symporter family protein [Rickettsiales bacterium]